MGLMGRTVGRADSRAATRLHVVWKPERVANGGLEENLDGDEVEGSCFEQDMGGCGGGRWGWGRETGGGGVESSRVKSRCR